MCPKFVPKTLQTPKTPKTPEDARRRRRRRRRPKTPKTPEDAEDALRRPKTPEGVEDAEDARRCRRRRRVANRSLETNSRFHLCCFTPTMSDQPKNCHVDLSWAMFYLPPSTLHHNTFNIWSKLTCRVIPIVILIDLVPCPHKTLCATYGPTWHLESCLKCLFLSLQQDNTLNRWRKLASWVMIETCNSSSLQCNTFSVWSKLTCGVFFLNLSPLDPTKQYIYIYTHSGPYKTLQSTSFSMKKPSRAMFNMPLPYLCKPIRWIYIYIYVYEQSRNDTSSLYFELLSFPWKTIPRTNQTMGFLSHFRNLQFRDPTLQYLEHVIIVGILSHCYDFFPFPLPCTNCYVQHMTQLGILSHFWHVPPRPFNMLTTWNKLTCRVQVFTIFLCFRRCKTILLNQQNCHLKSFRKFTRPSILQGNTFNIFNHPGILSHA